MSDIGLVQLVYRARTQAQHAWAESEDDTPLSAAVEAGVRAALIEAGWTPPEDMHAEVVGGNDD